MHTEAEDPFAPVATPLLSDVIAERITKAIKSGSLKPGDRLPTEHALADQLGVGRTSVREGLQKLRAFGVIEVRKGAGAYVTVPRTDDDPLAEFLRWISTNVVGIEELVEARIALEAIAAPLAAIRATSKEVDELAAHEADHRAAGRAHDLAGLVRSDEAFHDTIMAASRNPFVSRMYDVLIAELSDFRRRTLALEWAPERSAAGHDHLVDAIRNGDPAAARIAMLDHLWVVYDEIRSIVKADGSHESTLSLVPRDVFA